MDEIVVEQALWQRPDRQEPRLLALSAGFHEEWQLEAASIALGFGERSPGVACTLAVFAYPIGADHVAIVRVADRQQGDSDRPAATFLFQVLPRTAYCQLFGDPFALARRLPDVWESADGLPSVTLAPAPLPARTVEEVRQVLKRVKGRPLADDVEPDENMTVENSESPALLGGVQVLVDGGRVVFERPTADSGLIPALWTLLPYSTRNQLWPASFAFGNALGFDALVVPRAFGGEYNGYTSEDQAAEYPEGRYELNLQIAAETGDQRQLDILFQRRSWLETWRLGITLLLTFLLLALAAKIFL